MKNKRMERKKIMEALTRKDILDSAVTLLLKDGIANLTMDGVAVGAGIAKGTVYLYYKSKTALLNAVLDQAYLPLQTDLHTIILSEDEPIKKLEQFAYTCLQHSEDNKFLLRQLRTVLFATMDTRISNKNSWYWVLADRLGNVLKDAAASGIIRPVNYVKSAALFIDSTNSLMAHRILSEVQESIEQDVEMMLDLYLNGLKRNQQQGR